MPGAEQGIARSTLHKWKVRDGEINTETMDALCKHFNVPRHILDVSVREIDEAVLLECVEGVQRGCEEVGAQMPNESDRIFWAFKLYRQRMAGKEPALYLSDMKRTLETNVVRIKGE